MLKSIEIKGYRGFEHYRVEGLSRVNLLVGKNNCGKTALLEAVWLAVTEGDPRVLLDIAERRGELELIDDPRQYSLLPESPGAFVNHFFHGHAIENGASFSISSITQSGKDNSVSFNVGYVKDSRDRIGKNNLFDRLSDFPGDLLLEISNKNDSIPTIVIPVVLDQTTRLTLHNSRQHDRIKIPTVRYFFPELTRACSQSALWNMLLSNGRETDVVKVLRILAPEIETIHFLSRMNHYIHLASDSVIVVFQSGERVPLGTLGDGMRYLLGLAISLVQADGGVILIDEIDTGLHYSVMGDLWRLVIETAKRRDIQVFATTHSQDCIRGLAWLCDNYPDLKKEVSLQKIHPAIEKSVDVDGDGIVHADEQHIEVR